MKVEERREVKNKQTTNTIITFILIGAIVLMLLWVVFALIDFTQNTTHKYSRTVEIYDKYEQYDVPDSVHIEILYEANILTQGKLDELVFDLQEHIAKEEEGE